MVCNQSQEIQMTKAWRPCLMTQIKEASEKSFVNVTQYGDDDVTWKPRILVTADQKRKNPLPRSSHFVIMTYFKRVPRSLALVCWEFSGRIKIGLPYWTTVFFFFDEVWLFEPLCKWPKISYQKNKSGLTPVNWDLNSPLAVSPVKIFRKRASTKSEEIGSR